MTAEPARSACILVVDDEQDTLDLTEAILAAKGYQVLLARSAAEAFEHVTARPDLILLDVMMPQTSGLEVLARLRETPALARIPVILLTARQQDRDIVDGYRDGADYYITKPCTPAQILYGVELLLGRSSTEPTG